MAELTLLQRALVASVFYLVLWFAVNYSFEWLAERWGIKSNATKALIWIILSAVMFLVAYRLGIFA